LKNKTPPTWRHYLQQSIALPSLSSTAWPEDRAPTTAATSDRTPTFRGDNGRAQSITDRAWIISGPFDTGKSWAALWRLDSEARANPKGQYALVRKVRNDMDGTVLVTWKKLIQWRGGVTVFGGEKVQWYDYANGARVWIGGLDRPEKTLSGERDGVYVNQAEELDEADWEMLTRSTTGRGAVTRTPMLFGDCNPGPAEHWILRRKASGALTLLESHHEDNPDLFDDRGVITESGALRIGDLDRLTGVRYQRGRMGRWVGAEGAYYTQLDEARHIVPMPQYAGWDVWAALDYGFAHPLSFGVYTRDPYDNVYCIGHHAKHHWYIPQHADAMDSLLDQLGVDKQGLTVLAGHDCWNAGKDDPETIADKFGQRGYRLSRAIISRVLGARALGERLGNPACDPPILPSLFFVAQARPIFDCLTRMVHDPKNAEDVLKVNADAEGRGGDDDYDQTRYGVMHAPIRPAQMRPNPLQGVGSPQLVYVPGKGIRTAP
jgi:hypothetical protein